MSSNLLSSSGVLRCARDVQLPLHVGRHNPVGSADPLLSSPKTEEETLLLDKSTL